MTWINIAMIDLDKWNMDKVPSPLWTFEDLSTNKQNEAFSWCWLGWGPKVKIAEIIGLKHKSATMAIIFWGWGILRTFIRFHFVTLRTAALSIAAIIFKIQSSDWETGAIRREQVLQPLLAMPGFRIHVVSHHYPSLNKHRKVRSSVQFRQRHHSKSII